MLGWNDPVINRACIAISPFNRKTLSFSLIVHSEGKKRDLQSGEEEETDSFTVMAEKLKGMIPNKDIRKRGLADVYLNVR